MNVKFQDVFTGQDDFERYEAQFHGEAARMEEAIRLQKMVYAARIREVGRRSRKLNILVVEDSSEARRLVCGILRNLDLGRPVSPIEAENGREALSVLGMRPVDVILSDWRMPEMGGLEMLKEIREKKNLKDIPVIMLTAVAEKDEIIESIQAGATEYLLKPFTIEDLQDKISSVLRLAESAKQGS